MRAFLPLFLALATVATPSVSAMFSMERFIDQTTRDADHLDGSDDGRISILGRVCIITDGTPEVVPDDCGVCISVRIFCFEEDYLYVAHDGLP